MCCHNISAPPVLFHLFDKIVPVLERLAEMKRFPLNLGGHEKYLGFSYTFNRNDVTQLVSLIYTHEFKLWKNGQKSCSPTSWNSPARSYPAILENTHDLTVLFPRGNDSPEEYQSRRCVHFEQHKSQYARHDVKLCHRL